MHIPPWAAAAFPAVSGGHLISATVAIQPHRRVVYKPLICTFDCSPHIKKVPVTRLKTACSVVSIKPSGHANKQDCAKQLTKPRLTLIKRKQIVSIHLKAAAAGLWNIWAFLLGKGITTAANSKLTAFLNYGNYAVNIYFTWRVQQIQQHSYFHVLSYFLNPLYNLKGFCVEEPSLQDITVDDWWRGWSRWELEISFSFSISTRVDFSPAAFSSSLILWFHVSH